MTKSHARYVEACLIRGIGSNPRRTFPNTRPPSDDAGKLPPPSTARREFQRTYAEDPGFEDVVKRLGL